MKHPADIARYPSWVIDNAYLYPFCRALVSGRRVPNWLHYNRSPWSDFSLQKSQVDKSDGCICSASPGWSAYKFYPKYGWPGGGREPRGAQENGYYWPHKKDFWLSVLLSNQYNYRGVWLSRQRLAAINIKQPSGLWSTSKNMYLRFSPTVPLQPR